MSGIYHSFAAATDCVLYKHYQVTLMVFTLIHITPTII